MISDKEKKHDLNIDLLKIIVMVMVICLHYLSHQDFLHSDVGSPMYFMAWFLYGACVVSVDVFVIITGFYACGRQLDYNTRITRLLSTVLSAELCSMIVCLFCMVVFGAKLTLKNVIFSCFPTITNTNWFITAYVLLLILSPFIDKVVSKINMGSYKRALILMFLFICIFPSMSLQYRLMTKIEPGIVVLFLFLYMLGGYIRIYGRIKAGGVFGVIYLLTACILVLSKYILDLLIVKGPAVIANRLGKELIGKYSDKFYEYSSFVVVIGAFCLFMFFKNLKIKSNKSVIKGGTAFLASATLSVYVGHDQYLLRQDILWNRIVNTDILVKESCRILLLPAMMAATAVLIYVFFAVVHNLIIKQLIGSVIKTELFRHTVGKIENSKLCEFYKRFVDGF